MDTCCPGRVNPPPPVSTAPSFIVLTIVSFLLTAFLTCVLPTDRVSIAKGKDMLLNSHTFRTERNMLVEEKILDSSVGALEQG